MNWIKKRLQDLINLTRPRDDWRLASTSIWELDAKCIEHKVSKHATISPPSGSLLLISESSPIINKHEKKDIYPSLIDRLGARANRQRIVLRKTRKRN